MARLSAAGLSARGRLGAKGSDELLILVAAQNEARVTREVEGERFAVFSELVDGEDTMARGRILMSHNTLNVCLWQDVRLAARHHLCQTTISV